MNERTKIEVHSAALPGWWCLTQSDLGNDVDDIVSSLNILAGRIGMLGELLGESGELESVVVNEVGSMLKEMADAIDAFSGVIEEREIARKQSTKEPEPTALDILRRQQEKCGTMADNVREIHRSAMRKYHTAVIAEIEAGTRDEGDREEADRLLAEALKD